MLQPQSQSLPRVLGPWIATAIVVGTVIGSGVFVKGRKVADNVPEFGLVMGVWVLGGLLALLGSLALAEVAVLFPKAGGNYVFLREGYGRWAGFLSLPLNLPLALRLVWEGADGLWRWAGDTATDENHYSKRAILSAILVSTTAIDLASGREAALAYLDARIQNVMDFEKWKAGLKPADLAREVAGALASIRYGRP